MAIMKNSKNTRHGPRGLDGISPGSERERRLGFEKWIDLPVDVVVDGFPHRCRLVDASSTGMVVELTKTLAARDPQLLGTYEIHVSPGKILHVHGRTVWRSGALQAARFVGLSDDDRASIAEMVGTALLRVTSDVDRLQVAEQRDRLTAARPPQRRSRA